MYYYIKLYEISFYDLVCNNEVEIQDIRVINYNRLHIVWRYKALVDSELNFVSPLLAQQITCQARVKLLKIMDKLGYDRVLYFDTDSLFYLHDPTKYNPQLDNMLGCLEDELPHEKIIEFVGAGPKNYGYRTASGKTKLVIN